MDTDTAHHAWDAAWRTEEGRADWLTAEPDVVRFAAAARLAGGRRALDLGCGVGRHALALARLGFSVDAVDASAEGIARTRAAANGLDVAAREAMMTALPFGDGTFDALVSWNVIYHGAPDVVGATIAEITRLVRGDGRALLTMLSPRHPAYGIGEEIAPGTFVDAAASDDKVHPHYYCEAAELCALFPAFRIVSLREEDGGHWIVDMVRHAT